MRRGNINGWTLTVSGLDQLCIQSEQKRVERDVESDAEFGDEHAAAPYGNTQAVLGLNNLSNGGECDKHSTFVRMMCHVNVVQDMQQSLY
mmetsp:Transcript_18272/g.33355  ORF Transcript_18272/g.33355 Transcript_18272/m.33355 type:complete len:90 (+) Transcript_18272:449-718(+)